jgi:hypothetical protein
MSDLTEASSIVLDIYKADLSAAATELPADLASSIQDWQDYRNMVAPVQESSEFCMPAWIYKQWKDNNI